MSDVESHTIAAPAAEVPEEVVAATEVVADVTAADGEVPAADAPAATADDIAAGEETATPAAAVDRNAFKVYIGSIADGVTEEDVRALFANAGEIKELVVRRNYAFVTYTTEDDVNAALQLNGSALGSGNIQVELKRQSKRREQQRNAGGNHNRRDDHHQNRRFGNKDGAENNRTERVCYKCNKPGHIAARCGESDRLCFHCQKSGHLARDCPKAPARPFGDRRRDRRDDSRDRRRDRDDSRDRRDRSRSRRRDDSRDRRRRDDSRDRRDDSRDRRRRDDSRDDKKRRRL